MTNQDHGGAPAGDAIAELDAIWNELERGLMEYVAGMAADDDHLLIELAGPDDGNDGCLPYAQFAAYDDGAMLRAEIVGNSYLHPEYHLGRDAAEYLTRAGWQRNDDEEDGERNWYLELDATDLALICDVTSEVVRVLRYDFGIAHPHLLTCQAWGPAADDIEVLGLCATGDVPTDLVDTGKPTHAANAGALAFEPDDRDDLLRLVGSVLEAKYGEEPTVDDDGDFVLHHMGQPVWVCVRPHQPAIEVMTRVAHDVRSRRATAVEIALLNRDTTWVHWTLHDRTVWQTLLVVGDPFVPRHLDGMLDVFFQALGATRDDLALRTGAKVA